MTEESAEEEATSSQAIPRPSRDRWIIGLLAILTLASGVIWGVALGQVAHLRQQVNVLERQEATTSAAIPILVRNALTVMQLQAKVSSLEQSEQSTLGLNERLKALERRLSDLQSGSTSGSIDASRIDVPLGCGGQAAVWGPFGLFC